MSAEKQFKEPITAAELLSQLQHDPDYARMMREKEEQGARNRTEFERLERPVLDELHRIGITVTSVGNAAFFENYFPLSEPAVDVLLRWVPIAHPRVQECLVRLLAAAARPFDGRALAQLFDRADSEDLRWVIANTIEAARPQLIEDWLKERLLAASAGASTRPLFKALSRVGDRCAVVDVARKLLDTIPDAVAPVLAKYGTADDIPALLRTATREAPGIQRKHSAAVQKIARRV
jgi:hypothetical protein